jgi:competence protein CoiA
MQFALVNEQREEAQPGLSGWCVGCGHPMVAKCGEEKAWHWAHKVGSHCDHWWESETNWHRAWKNRFPAECRESRRVAENGEWHIADVRTARGWVIEFQHSYIDPEERRARNAFYRMLTWVVDGTRRKTDMAQLTKALNGGAQIGPNIFCVRANECALLREWACGPGFNFIDFGGDQVLWWLHARRPDGFAYVAPISRAGFIDFHLGEGTPSAHHFEAFVNEIGGLIEQRERAMQQATVQLPSGFPLRPVRRRRTPRF